MMHTAMSDSAVEVFRSDIRARTKAFCWQYNLQCWLPFRLQFCWPIVFIWAVMAFGDQYYLGVAFYSCRSRKLYA